MRVVIYAHGQLLDWINQIPPGRRSQTIIETLKKSIALGEQTALEQRLEKLERRVDGIESGGVQLKRSVGRPSKSGADADGWIRNDDGYIIAETDIHLTHYQKKFQPTLGKGVYMFCQWLSTVSGKFATQDEVAEAFIQYQQDFAEASAAS